MIATLLRRRAASASGPRAEEPRPTEGDPRPAAAHARATEGAAAATLDISDPAAAPTATGSTPGLVLGPLLRHVGATDATIWVETDSSCEVSVSTGTGARATARTFQVAGHHYALVVLSGLAPGTSTPYTVALDDERVWPPADSPYPPSIVRTVDPARPLRLLFGSCRSPVAVKVHDPTGSGEDVLGGYARRMQATAPETWPEALLMLGDQVYADEPSDRTRRWLAARRDLSRPPGAQVANFEEYTTLYREAWGDPDVRWLLSVLPTSMIFDDHDVIDDWNTSAAWRRDMARRPWWRERIIGALASYWVYQHLGNLSPGALAEDPMWRQVHEVDDAAPILRAYAVAADHEADGARGALWSYRRDLGVVRLLVIDSRAGRILGDGRRAMVGEAERAWIRDAVADLDYRHLVIGTSVPWLLPLALHDVEAADEALCAGTRGRGVARLAEVVRRAVDLEHWAAFNESFEYLADLVRWVGRGGDGGRAPASICVLSGDVHHTYVSRARFREPVESRVHQLTCSPMHNGIPLPMRAVFSIAWTRWTERAVRRLLLWAKGRPATFDWTTVRGPWFGNHVATLTFDGESARFALDKSELKGEVTLATPVPDAEIELAPAAGAARRPVDTPPRAGRPTTQGAAA